MTAEEMNLIDAERALVWAADGVWSARVTPTQSRALLDELERLRKIEATAVLLKDQRAREERVRVQARFGGGADSAIGAPPDFGRSSA